MKRRGFLGGILAACVAPAIGTAGILMPVKKIYRPEMEIGRYESFRFIESALLPDPEQVWRRTGRYGFVDAKFYYRAVELNQGWMT